MSDRRGDIERHQALGTAKTDVHPIDLQAIGPDSQHGEKIPAVRRDESTYAKRISPSELDSYAEKLATWRGIEATTSRKQRRNLKQIRTLQIAQVKN